MAQTSPKSAIQKIALSASRDIPFNKLLLSACNVRRILLLGLAALAQRQKGAELVERMLCPAGHAHSRLLMA